jgi:ABC-type nickel/cobalt efflux system permease component RcnA
MRLAKLGAVVAVTAALVAVPAVASAHPLGDFTVNRYSGLVVAPDEIRVHHVLDLAEIPTVQARESGRDLPSYADRRCTADAGAMQLSVAGKPATLRVARSAARLLPGQAGLQTMRIECDLAAPVDVRARSPISFVDRAGRDQIGWREVTARGDRATLVASDVPTASTSKALAAYPKDLLSSPLDQITAKLTAEPGGPALAADPVSAVLGRPTDRLSSAFADLTGGKDLSVPFAVLAILLAVAIGAAHALAPGHGKTVMAFYLAGRGERARRAALTVGATVTLTHTAGVLVLGVLVSTTASIAPASAYPWLGALSGLLVLAVGAGLLRDAIRSRRGATAALAMPASELVTADAVAVGEGGAHRHDRQHAHPHQDSHGHPHDHGRQHPQHLPHPHPHDHDHGHAHPHPHGHAHPHPHRHRRGLVAMGLAGGVVPSPTALVVLLGAAAVGRAWFGVLLVVAFGVGMAATLALAGLAVLHAGRRLSRLAAAGRLPRLRTLAGVLPALTATGVCTVGLLIAIRGLAAAI